MNEEKKNKALKTNLMFILILTEMKRETVTKEQYWRNHFPDNCVFLITIMRCCLRTKTQAFRD